MHDKEELNHLLDIEQFEDYIDMAWQPDLWKGTCSHTAICHRAFFQA